MLVLRKRETKGGVVREGGRTVLEVVMSQPWLLPLEEAQLVLPILPDICLPEVMLHPLEVWRVAWSVLARLTPSMMSISPSLGQLGPTSQKAGHVP